MSELFNSGDKPSPGATSRVPRAEYSAGSQEPRTQVVSGPALRVSEPEYTHNRALLSGSPSAARSDPITAPSNCAPVGHDSTAQDEIYIVGQPLKTHRGDQPQIHRTMHTSQQRDQPLKIKVHGEASLSNLTLIEVSGLNGAS